MRRTFLASASRGVLLAALMAAVGAACSALPSYQVVADGSLDASVSDALPDPKDVAASKDGLSEGGATDGARDAGYRYQVFVTSNTFPGNGLGGLAGADLLCQTAGQTFKPGATWTAYLWKSATEGPETRVPAGRPYYRVGDANVMVFASTNISPLQPVLNTELGIPAVTVTTWIGENEATPKGRCGEWAGLDGGGAITTTGLSNSTTNWRSSVGVTCDTKAALFCFETQ